MQFSSRFFGPRARAHKIRIPFGFWHNRNPQAMRLYALTRQPATPDDKAGTDDGKRDGKNDNSNHGPAPKSDLSPPRDAARRHNAFLPPDSMGSHGPQLLKTHNSKQKYAGENTG